jgi:hypothetical protein
MRGRRFAQLASGLAVATLACAAHANGRFPTAQQIALAPNDPDLMLLMATYGVNVSHDKGKTWDWVCETAVGYMSNEDPTLGITQRDTILISTFEGLGASSDQACSWTLPVQGITRAADLVVEKADPHTAFVLTSGFAGVGDAGSTFTSAVWVTHDDGATFTQVGPNLDPAILAETIDVAPSDPTRVYVSGTRTVAGAPTGVLLYSTDGGQTFAETDLPFSSADRAPYIAAVDPTNPDRVYVRVRTTDTIPDGGAPGPAGSRVLVSDDGLKTVRQVWQAGSDLLGFAVSPDGTKVYAGGPYDGLHVASSTALDFTTQTSPVQIECLNFEGATLLACSQEVSGFTIGSTTDDGATWTPMFHMSCERGPLNCGASSLVASQCGTLWESQQSTLGGPDPKCTADAGAAAPDAGTASGSAPAKSSGGCALSATGVASTPPLVVLAGAALAFAARLRRRKRRG